MLQRSLVGDPFLSFDTSTMVKQRFLFYLNLLETFLTEHNSKRLYNEFESLLDKIFDIERTTNDRQESKV